MANPRQLVDPPAFTPLPHGLLDVAQPINPGDSHWQNGITYQTRCINSGATTYDDCIAITGSGDDSPPPPEDKEATTTLELRGATAFTVYTKFDCAPVGIDDAQAIATDALAQSEPWQVERAFWSGVAGGQSIVYPHLAADAEVTDGDGIIIQTAADAVTGGPYDIACGLGLLEQELADCYGGVGVIHVPRRVLPTLCAHNLVYYNDDNELVTKNGNLVAVGVGYSGTSPAGADAAEMCESWIYATGAVFVYSGSVRVHNVRDSIDRAENTVEMIAERTYVIGWDCCHIAVHIRLGVDYPILE